MRGKGRENVEKNLYLSYTKCHIVAGKSLNEKKVEELLDLIRGELTDRIKPEDLQESREDDKVIFTFTWLLKEPMRLIFDTKKEQLLMPDILEDIPPESAIYADLLLLTDEFGAGRERLLEIYLLNKNGSVSILCKPKHDVYNYGAEKVLKLANEIFQKTFENYPKYTKEKFNQVMTKVRIRGADHAIPIVLTPYQKDLEKTRPYRSPGSWDLATLTNPDGEYYYEQGNFFLGMIAGIDNIRLPILGFKDWYSGNYKIVYPLYKDLKKEGSKTYHTLAGFDLLDISEVFNSFQEAISKVREYLLKINLSRAERMRIESWFDDLPSHPVDLYVKYFALRDAADFISRLLSAENYHSLEGISEKLADIIDEEDRKKLMETAVMLMKIRDKRDSAASFDDSLQRTLAFREAVRIAVKRDRTTKILESNVRNISRSGGGKSVYLGKEELKWIRLGEKALVKIVEYEPFRCRIEIYPM